jgi:cell division protease FtsH
MQLPTDEQFLLSRSELNDRIRGTLGGRAAEEIVFNEITTGAENDLERATALARQMVCVYGMSERLGLAHCAQRQAPYLAPGMDGSFQRDCSEQTAREVDEEVKRLLDRCYTEAKDILAGHRDQLDLVASELLKRETLDRRTFYTLIGKAEPKEDLLPAKADKNLQPETVPL